MSNTHSVSSDFDSQLASIKQAHDELKTAKEESKKILSDIKSSAWSGKNKVAVKDLVEICNKMLKGMCSAEKDVYNAFKQYKEDDANFRNNNNSLNIWRQ